MKIGIDARLWNETGVGRYIRNLVKELQILDKKNEYILFVISKDYELVKSQINNKKFQIKIANIHWHTVSEQQKFPKIIKKENVDLMHFPYFSIPIFYNKPYVITIHDLILNHFSTGKASTLFWIIYKIKHQAYKYILKSAVKNAKTIMVPLEAVKNDVKVTYHVPDSKIAVTYEGVDENLTRKGINKDITRTLNKNKYFLYVGNAYPHKNINSLIKAFVEFRRDTGREVQLLLVGKDDFFYKKLKSIIEPEHLSGITFKHDVTDDELENLYKSALAFISPSLMEGFGLPSLEALASSCLVLASDIPSFREVMKDSAIYFDPYSITSIKEKMKYVYNLEQGTKDKYIKKGLARVSEFSWEKMAEQTLQIYESSISL